MVMLFHGDESHGIEPAKKSPKQKHIQGFQGLVDFQVPAKLFRKFLRSFFTFVLSR